MPFYVGRVVDHYQKLIIRTPQFFRDKMGIDVRTEHVVLELDLQGRRVRYRRLSDGSEAWHSYDKLLIATGAVPFCPELPGMCATGIFGVNSLQRGIEIRQYLDETRPRRAVIAGGGFIGLEMADALAAQGISVTIVDREPQVMGTLDVDMGALVAEGLRAAGVEVRTGETITGFETSAGRVAGVVTGNGTIPAELVVLGMGVRPNSGLARDAGMELGESESIRVNMRMETSEPGVWAAGDCAESFHLVSNHPYYIALGTVANKQGKVAGINIAGGHAVFPGVVGTSIVKVCHLEVARTGLQEKELRKLQLDWVAGKIEARNHAGYYPGAGPMTVKILAEKGTGRLLGGQIVGAPGAGKRIDIIATALHARFSVAQVADLDLAYSPPFSEVWDPVAIAARETTKLL